MAIDELLEAEKSFCEQYRRLQKKEEGLKKDHEQLKKDIEREIYDDFERFLNERLPEKEKFSDWQVRYSQNLEETRDTEVEIRLTHFDGREIWRGYLDGNIFFTDGGNTLPVERQLEIAKTFSANYCLKVKIKVQEEE
ncbi:hypothetical protein HYV87_05695 [Candidatus Woesearchaeota archaeon]|nr:hypothetical protein [Candidatus Woesearchaeota archaeon]